MTTRLLATTALEDTWGTDEPVLFLGEWCKLYDRRKVWGARDHQTVRFHWDDRRKLTQDYDYLETLHHALVDSLTAALNELHGVSQSRRYWQILLDPFLMAWLGVVYDRWECLRVAVEEHPALETVIADSRGAPAPALSYYEFMLEASASDAWNRAMFQHILERRYADQVRFRRGGSDGGTSTQPPASPPPRRRLRWRVAAGLDRLLSRVPLATDAAFVESYFGPAALIRLNLALRQVPRLYLTEFAPDGTRAGHSPSRAPAAATATPDRKQLHVAFKPCSAFEEYIRNLMPEALPRCLVEAYDGFREQANAARVRTRAIVTANAHWHNAAAKAWMAEQVDRGVRLVILEHGGSFPARKELFDFEEDIADVKCTWFRPYHPKHLQLPPSKLSGRVNRERRRPLAARDHCVVIGNTCPRYVYRAHYYPMAAQCLVSLEQVVALHAHLRDDVRRAVRVKPVPADKAWNTRQRYADALGRECVLAEGRMDRALRRARLIVCTYPETTFSEAMASGLPTILIYPDHLNERHAVSYPLLQRLRSSNIVFHDPAVAAAHINSVWHDPDRWWRNPETRSACAEFRRQALDVDGDWLAAWSRFIREATA